MCFYVHRHIFWGKKIELWNCSRIFCSQTKVPVQKLMSQIPSITKKTNLKWKLKYQEQKEISKSRFAGLMSQINHNARNQKNKTLTDER